MSVDIGIIGLPKSGRTTIFNALTGGKANTVSYSRESLSPHLGVARVPEPRLEALAAILNPKKVTQTEVRYIDVGASVKGLAEDRAVSGEILGQLSKVDSLTCVVRAFSDECVPHLEGSLDTERDITIMDSELAFSDLVLQEKRLEKIGDLLKAAKPPERPALLREQEMLARIKHCLEENVPVRELKFTTEESKILSHFQLLTAKPLLRVVNIGEDELAQAPSLEAELRECHVGPGSGLLTLCGKLEMELSQLEATAAQELRAEYGVLESGLDRTIQLSYELLGLISFFSIASGEIRAWPVRRGTSAQKAAGKIHSDMEKGFIRAEVLSYDDLDKCGSLAEARQKGLLRLEGKGYEVQDGDIITFLFNV
ncbi:redox-regulated ATPase YchF [Chloroflexota bacterium]